MSRRPGPRVYVLGLLLAAPWILPLAGCGSQSDTPTGAEDPSSQSVSSYEAEIAKSKAASPRRPARKDRG